MLTLTRGLKRCVTPPPVPLLVAEILDSRRLAPDLTDDEGNTLLHIASANGHDRVVWCLIEHGADVNLYNLYRWTALIQAAAYGHAAVISILLEAGALVDVTNVLGASALACAARGGHIKVVAALLSAEAPITTHDGTVTPLMMASFAGHESVCQLLVDRGAPVDTVVQDTGWTALMFAAHNGLVQAAGRPAQPPHSPARDQVASRCWLGRVVIIPLSLAARLPKNHSNRPTTPALNFLLRSATV